MCGVKSQKSDLLLGQIAFDLGRAHGRPRAFENVSSFHLGGDYTGVYLG